VIASAGAAVLLWPQPEHHATAPPAPPARSTGPLVAALVSEHPDGPTRGALEHRLPHLGVVAPDWARVRKDGYFDYTTLEQSTRDLQARGARLLPVVHDPAGAIGDVLADAGRTNRLALRLAAGLKTIHADGVLLDVDDVPASGREQFPELVRTLRKLMGDEATIVVSVPASAALGWATGYDLRDLSRPALVLVDAYGEHGPDTEPGPVASLDWFRTVVRAAVHAAPRERLLLGIPTWGYRWDRESVQRISQAQSYPLLTELAREGQDGAELQLDGDATWVETDRSVELKLKVARAAKVAGIALELGGGESTHLWDAPLVGLEPAA
jgi:spore germination protein YaaH